MSQLIAFKQPNSYITECYKMLRTNLNFMNYDEDKKTLMITSSVSEEGKSTTICNLAITMAQTGKKVLVIEGDLRRPRIHDLFEVPQTPGLTNLLLEKKPVKDAIKSIPDAPGLNILTAGTLPPTPSEFLASDKFKEFVTKAKEEYDFIIIDAPPVLSVTDATVISKLVDGVVLVVAANETPKPSIMSAKKALEKVGVDFMGVVLTKMKMKKQERYYKDYYVDESKTKNK